ncbi:MAG: hypothetical protein J7599_05765 [Niabella sp.]|nr:hypothetical protein [Niabella sp.]
MVFTILRFAGQAQTQPARFSPDELKEDLACLRHLLTAVHVNPNGELAPAPYNELFNSIAASLKDSASATEFLKKIRPVVARLSDEHAQINLKPELLTPAYRSEPIYPPFTLKKKGNRYYVDQYLGNMPAGNSGEAVLSINGVPVAMLLTQCALATTGYPDQRMKTALRQFGYLYPWAVKEVTTSFILKTAAGKTLTIPGISLKDWDAFRATQAVPGCAERLSYTRYGNRGYINACSFDVKAEGPFSRDSIRARIDNVFKQIQADGITQLIIDVSRNEGGSTVVGDYLISYIHHQPYKGYQMNWKRSDAYLKLLRSWGFDNAQYAAEPVGKVLHFASEQVVPEAVPYPYHGKTVVVIGPATFSSAMSFATLIKDNRIAPLMGQTPVNGHPTSIGEMFYTNLPHTQIFVRFGVKEHIRPAGKIADNNLQPDILLTDEQMRNVNLLLKQVK